MKKVIIALSMLCLINSVNAASISWTTGIIRLADGTTPALGCAVYLFDIATPYNSTDFASFSAELEAAIKGGTFLTGGYDALAVLDGKTNPSGTAPEGALAGKSNIAMGEGPWASGQVKTLFMVVFDAGDYDSADKFQLTTGITKTLGSATQTFGFGTEGLLQPGNWEGIPEPATMALVGVGIVALGLRRRRK